MRSSDELTRRSLILAGMSLAAGVASRAMSQTVPKRPPAIEAELVKEFVIAGHGDLQKTKEMLEKKAGLLNACWDWGGGDFETALEGAGHMGNREIAEFLIARGARLNIFCAAMLGQLDSVKAMLEANPGLKNAKGPHGITLATHAEKGGDSAKAVLEYLRSQGIA